MFGALVLVLLAWGALAFGGVYDWAYRPLLWGGWLLGALVLAMPGWCHDGQAGSIGWGLGLGLCGVAGALILQLVPLPSDLLQQISPATHEFLRAYDIRYSAALLAGGAPMHAISIRPEASQLGAAFFVSFALLFFACTVILERGASRTVVSGLVGLGTVLALVAIVQTSLTPGKIYGLWEPIDGREPFGPFVNRNHFAGWMLMTLSVALGYLASALPSSRSPRLGDWRGRLTWFASTQASRVALVSAGTLVMGIALALTLSRSGIGGFILAAAVLGVIALRTRRDPVNRTFMGVYVVLLIVLTVNWVGVDRIGQQFAGVALKTEANRLGIWQDTLGVVRDFPLTGTGLNTFGTVMLAYQTVDPRLSFRAAHNDYLQLASEGGLLLGLPLILTIVAFGRQVAIRLRERPGGRGTHWLRVGAVTGLAAIGLQETVDFSLQMPGNAALFVVLAAIAVHRPLPACSREPK